MRSEFKQAEAAIACAGGHLAWWVENVSGAAVDMVAPTMLCGPACGLQVCRHRFFDSNFGVEVLGCDHAGVCVGLRSPYRQRQWASQGCQCGGNLFQLFGGHHGGVHGTFAEHKSAMKMEWAQTIREVHQAIPPIYAMYMARSALKHLVFKYGQ